MQKSFFNPETRTVFSALTELKNTQDQAACLAELDFKLSLALAEPAPKKKAQKTQISSAEPESLDAASWAALAVFRAQLEAPDPRLQLLAAMLKPLPQDPEKILNFAASADSKIAGALIAAILIGNPEAWPEKAVTGAVTRINALSSFAPSGDKNVAPLARMPERPTPLGASQTSRLISALAVLGK